MPFHNFELPAGTSILPSSLQDTRSDEEISASLVNPPTEVTSQKNNWAFWDKGFNQLHGWQKRNVTGWVRKLGPGWTVRVLDLVEGSPTNVLKYVDESNLPEAILNRSMTGPHSGQHMSDLIRLPLLYQYGGIYLDIGAMLLGDLEESLWKKIEDPNSDYRIGGFAHYRYKNNWSSMQNCCIAAQKGEEMIQRWQRVLLEVWKGRTSCQGLVRHPIFDGVPAEPDPLALMSIRDGKEELLLDYWVNLLAWEKLKVTVDDASGFNGPEYVRKHVLLLEPTQEAFLADLFIRGNTIRFFNMLTCRRNTTAGGLGSPLHWEAKGLVNFLLTNSTFMKLYHGHGYLQFPPVTTFLEVSETGDADVRPGTFGEYLRYAGEIIDQQRIVEPLSLDVYDGPIVRGTLP